MYIMAELVNRAPSRISIPLFPAALVPNPPRVCLSA